MGFPATCSWKIKSELYKYCKWKKYKLCKKSIKNCIFIKGYLLVFKFLNASAVKVFYSARPVGIWAKHKENINQLGWYISIICHTSHAHLYCIYQYVVHNIMLLALSMVKIKPYRNKYIQVNLFNWVLLQVINKILRFLCIWTVFILQVR